MMTDVRVVSIVLVVGVLAPVTTARDGLQTCFGELEAIKDNSGVAQCVTSPPPKKTVTAGSMIDCMKACLDYGCSCAYGANIITATTGPVSCTLNHRTASSKFRIAPTIRFLPVRTVRE